MKKLLTAVLMLFSFSTMAQASKDSCSKIITFADKFTGDTMFYFKEIDGISCTLNRVKGKSELLISFKVIRQSLEFRKKGLIVLLENNKRIQKDNEEINVKAHPEGYIYSANFFLTPEEQKLFSENAVTDFKLYVFAKSVTEGKSIVALINCLSSK